MGYLHCHVEWLPRVWHQGVAVQSLFPEVASGTDVSSVVAIETQPWRLHAWRDLPGQTRTSGLFSGLPHAACLGRALRTCQLWRLAVLASLGWLTLSSLGCSQAWLPQVCLAVTVLVGMQAARSVTRLRTL